MEENNIDSPTNDNDTFFENEKRERCQSDTCKNDNSTNHSTDEQCNLNSRNVIKENNIDLIQNEFLNVKLISLNENSKIKTCRSRSLTNLNKSYIDHVDFKKNIHKFLMNDSENSKKDNLNLITFTKINETLTPISHDNKNDDDIFLKNSKNGTALKELFTDQFLRLMEREKEVESLTENLERSLAYLKQKNDALLEARKSITSLDLTIKDLKQQLYEKNANQQQMYLEMFKKGRDSLQFEYQTEIVRPKDRVKSERKIESRLELEKKLMKAQAEIEQLRKQQALAQQNKTDSISTNEEIYFKFAKDAFYYYIIATDQHKKVLHLKTLVELFQYDELTLSKIREAINHENNI